MIGEFQRHRGVARHQRAGHAEIQIVFVTEGARPPPRFWFASDDGVSEHAEALMVASQRPAW